MSVFRIKSWGDFMSHSGAILDYKSKPLNICKRKMPLEQNIHIGSGLRVRNSSVLYPRSMNVIPLKFKAQQYFPKG